MNGPDSRDRLAESFHQRPLPENAIWSAAIGLLAGAYMLFKALEFLGFPVWLWLHQAVDCLVHFQNRLLQGSADAGSMTSGATLFNRLGLNGSGILKKGVHGVTQGWAKSFSDSPAGLRNSSVACYQNSIIQGLASLRSFQEYLQRAKLWDDAKATTTLNDLIERLNDPANKGKSFWVNGLLNSMSSADQQDAQEYFDNIMAAIQKELVGEQRRIRRSAASLFTSLGSFDDSPSSTAARPPSASENVDAPRFPLDGLQVQRVGCCTCGYFGGLKVQELSCLTVHPNNSIFADISECIDETTKMEMLSGIECAKCTLLRRKKMLLEYLSKPAPDGVDLSDIKVKMEQDYARVTETLDEELFDADDNIVVKNCNIKKNNWVKTNKSKQIVFASAPTVLPIHFNRSMFHFDGYDYRLTKNRAEIGFSEELDLGPWILPYPQQPHDMWRTDPNKSLVCGLDEQSDWTHPVRKVVYELRAVIKHRGMHDSGHYVCFGKRPRVAESADNEALDVQQDERWWAFDDDLVTEVPADTVFGKSSEGPYQFFDVFMLLYEKKTIDEEDLPVEPILDEPPKEALPEVVSALVPEETDNEPSEVDTNICDGSEGTPSTQLTSDDETDNDGGKESAEEPDHSPHIPLGLMRAGDMPRAQEGAVDIPRFTATY